MSAQVPLLDALYTYTHMESGENEKGNAWVTRDGHPLHPLCMPDVLYAADGRSLPSSLLSLSFPSSS